MAILSSKHFKLLAFHKSKKVTVTPGAALTARPCLVAKLPKELLGCIYQQLETRECQIAFSGVCKVFHCIALDMRMNASWMVTRYGRRFAIYYALLSFPQKCTHAFLQLLLNHGAIIPRYLIQVLIGHYGKSIDHLVKSSESRRRRSSFDTLDLDLFFLKGLQSLPFDGYATLISHAFQYYGNTIDIQKNDLNEFLSMLDKTMYDQQRLKDLIQDHWFFPGPLSGITHTNYRHVLKLAYTLPESYALISPVFDFDPVARSALWESILLLFFDEAFKSTEPNKEKQLQFNIVKQSIITHKGRHVQLVGPFNDQQIFCQVFATFFTKYPMGYCNEKTMSKLLRLLVMYVEPNFNIEIALEYMVQANIGRSDTIESLDQFLKNK